MTNGSGRTPTLPRTTPAARRTSAPTRRTSRWRSGLVYLGMAAIIVYCIAPFYWMIVSSLRRTSDIFDKSPIPTPLSLENYRAVLDPSQGFGRALANSVIVAASTTVLALLIGTVSGYALARLRLRIKRVTMLFIVATSMFPVVAIVVPLLKLFTGIGWINTYQAMVLPSLSFALPLAVWILTAFFRQMPHELEEAAMMDGCTRGQAFRRVVLPLAAPGIFTTAIMVFVGAWNEFMIALTMTNDAAVQTAPVAIAKFTGATRFETPFGSQMAAGVLVTIPLVVLVLIFQRRIIAGLTTGGLK